MNRSLTLSAAAGYAAAVLITLDLTAQADSGEGCTATVALTFLLLLGIVSGYVFWTLVRRAEERVVWLEGALDAVPQPITVTGLNMRWVYVNKVTEELFGKTRERIRDRRCSEWGAPICGAEKCGIASLRAAKPQTLYMQRMPDGTDRCMQVDTSYVLNHAGHRIVHVEIVTDIHSSFEIDNLRSRIGSSLEAPTGLRWASATAR